MKKLYEEKEVLFAVLWIVIYVVGTSLTDSLSESVGHMKLLTLVFHAGISLILIFWMKKEGLFEKYGLKATDVPASKFVFYIPLAIISTAFAWWGIGLNYPITDSLIFAGSMLCVGFLEEVIFRGLLFKAIEKSNQKEAILISSLTFGIGHIVNLFNGHGAELISTACQVCYAVAFGFLFVLIFYRGRTLLPCIIAHSVIDIISVFGNRQMEPRDEIVLSVILTVLIVAYILVLRKTLPKAEQL